MNALEFNDPLHVSTEVRDASLSTRTPEQIRAERELAKLNAEYNARVRWWRTEAGKARRIAIERHEQEERERQIHRLIEEVIVAVDNVH